MMIQQWRAMRDGKCGSGYTLIELMVVLAIVSLLAALAFPAFQQYVIKGKRAQAQAALMQLMQQQERYYTQNGIYLAFSAAAAGPFTWWSGSSAAHSAYELRAGACAQQTLSQCVMLTALPGTGKVDSNFKDAECETLTLDSAGQRRASGPAQRCWP
jgi:type IV pilus assembly protein PilE